MPVPARAQPATGLSAHIRRHVRRRRLRDAPPRHPLPQLEARWPDDAHADVDVHAIRAQRVHKTRCHPSRSNWRDHTRAHIARRAPLKQRRACRLRRKTADTLGVAAQADSFNPQRWSTPVSRSSRLVPKAPQRDDCWRLDSDGCVRCYRTTWVATQERTSCWTALARCQDTNRRSSVSADARVVRNVRHRHRLAFSERSSVSASSMAPGGSAARQASRLACRLGAAAVLALEPRPEQPEAASSSDHESGGRTTIALFRRECCRGVPAVRRESVDGRCFPAIVLVHLLDFAEIIPRLAARRQSACPHPNHVCDRCLPGSWIMFVPAFAMAFCCQSAHLRDWPRIDGTGAAHLPIRSLSPVDCS